MNRLICSAIGFVTGSIIGSAMTYMILRKPMEEEFQRRVDSIKDTYRKESEKYAIKNYEKGVEEAKNKTTVEEKLKVFSTERTDYTQFWRGDDSDKKDSPLKKEAKISIISPEEFGEMGYQTINLTYFADGVLVDDRYGVMEEDELELAVGRDSLSHFGDYEEDSVHVRNEQREIDYEILLDPRTYEEFLETEIP